MSALSNTAEQVEPTVRLRTATLQFAIERYADWIDEAMPLIREHWQEIAEDKDLNELNPNHDLYRRIDDAGALLLLTARVGGDLVGYVLMTVVPHPHYRHRIMASEDAHFLHPDYRNGLAGYRLIRRALAEAKARGADYVTMRTKRRHDHGRLFERAGGRLLDHVYIFRTGAG